MARFYDRMLSSGVARSTADTLTGPDVALVEGHLRAQYPTATVQELHAMARSAAAQAPTVGPAFNVADIEDLPVIAGDEVARYIATFGGPLDVFDHVPTMAPPFDRFWVDFSAAPDPTGTGIRAWGALVESLPDPSAAVYDNAGADELAPRWLLHMRTFVERDRGRPVGPVTSHFAGLAADGSVHVHDDGGPFWAGGLELDPTTPDPGPDVQREAAALSVSLLFPAMLTMALMHCSNVQVTVEQPPAKVAAKYAKKHGRPPTRYLVLDIEPMRRVLATAGATDRAGLRRALHLCRGHFKTFTADAPLFGRLTGTFWWAPALRGSPDQGAVEKDYRVDSPPSIGRMWPTREPRSGTVGLCAEAVVSAGLSPRRPRRGEPDYDIGFLRGPTVVVAIVAEDGDDVNAKRALAIRCRQALEGAGHAHVEVALVTPMPLDLPPGGLLEDVAVVTPEAWCAAI